MKTFKILLLGAVSFVAMQAASAQTKIYIAGSNGDRAATNTAIPKILTGTVTFAGTNSDPTKANFGVFTGGSIGGVPVTIKVAFIGATGGIAAVAGSKTVKFVPDGVTGGSVPDPTVSGNANEAHVPDFSMSTNFQSSSPFSGSYLGSFYEELDDELIGVTGLKFVGSKNFPGTNLTTNAAQYLFGTGRIPLSFITGSNADRNKVVFAIGRNTDAGQRYAAGTEIGLGLNAVYKHWKPVISGAAAGVGGFVVGGTVTSHALWPIETFSGVSSQFLGNGGFPTGATLAPALTAVLGSNAYTLAGTKPGTTAGYYLGYLTETDANTIAIANGAVELKWNGVTYSDTAIREGQYTFWVYSHILKRQSLSGTPLDIYEALANQILTVDANVSGLLYSSVSVQRSAEGGVVGAKYSY